MTRWHYSGYQRKCAECAIARTIYTELTQIHYTVEVAENGTAWLTIHSPQCKQLGIEAR